MRNFGITYPPRQATEAASGASTVSYDLPASHGPPSGRGPTPTRGETPVPSCVGLSFDPAVVALDQNFDDREFAALIFAFACFVSPVLIGGAFIFGLLLFLA